MAAKAEPRLVPLVFVPCFFQGVNRTPLVIMADKGNREFLTVWQFLQNGWTSYDNLLPTCIVPTRHKTPRGLLTRVGFPFGWGPDLQLRSTQHSPLADARVKRIIRGVYRKTHSSATYGYPTGSDVAVAATRGRYVCTYLDVKLPSPYAGCTSHPGLSQGLEVNGHVSCRPARHWRIGSRPPPRYLHLSCRLIQAIKRLAN